MTREGIHIEEAPERRGWSLGCTACATYRNGVLEGSRPVLISRGRTCLILADASSPANHPTAPQDRRVYGARGHHQPAKPQVIQPW